MDSVLKQWAAERRGLAEQAALGVVGIERERGVRFSGIVWDSEILVTAAEMLQGADSVRVQTARGTVSAQVLACDLSVDVAVLKADTGAPGVSAAQPTGLAAGDEVLVAGHGRAGTSVVWTQVEEVGPTWRSRSGGQLDRLIRFAPGLHPTLEGGGTFDLDGRLCAMAVRGPRRLTLGIPPETIERVVSTVLQQGRLPQPYLGVRLQRVWLDESLRKQLSREGTEGAVVVGVEPDSPAVAAGLMFGDLILTLAGETIGTAIDLKVALARVPPGTPTAVEILRAGHRQVLSVVVHDRSRP